MRVLTLSLVLLLVSCSLFEEGEALALLWHDNQYAPIDVGTGLLGTTGGGHYFTTIGSAGLVAYELEGGRRAWSTTGGGCEPPSFVGGRVFCPGYRRFGAFDATTGERLWSVEFDSGLSSVRGTADTERAYGGTLTEALALDAATGAVVWRRGFDGPGWTGTRLRSLTLSPEGDLLVAFEALFSRVTTASMIVAVDPATGEERWRFQYGDGTTNQITGGISFWQDLMLYSDRFEVIAVDRRTRAVRWRSPTTPAYGSPRTPPVIRDGTAYFSDGWGGVFAVDASTGRRQWTAKVPGGTWHHDVCGGYLLVNLEHMAVLDRSSGRLVGWLVSRGADVGQTAVEGDRLYATTDSGVYAFNCSR